MSYERLKRFFLIAEFLVAFAPLIILLQIGLLLAVFQVVMLFISAESRAHPFDALPLILRNGAGVLGMVSFVNLAIAIFNESKVFLDRKTTLSLGLFGYGAIIYLIFDSDTWVWRWFFIVPLIVALHATYLGRVFLFPRLWKTLP